MGPADLPECLLRHLVWSVGKLWHHAVPPPPAPTPCQQEPDHMGSFLLQLYSFTEILDWVIF